MTYLLHGHTSFTGMGWMDRIPLNSSNSVPSTGDIYIGGLYALYQPNLIADHGITHVLSVIDYHTGLEEKFPHLKVLHVDAEDHPRENLLKEFERCVRFVEGAVCSSGDVGEGRKKEDQEDATTQRHNSDNNKSKDQEEERNLPDPSSSSALAAPSTTTTTTTASKLNPNPNPNQNIFIHCAMGKSRSATLVAAYLIWKHALSPTSALAKICEARPVCEPNPGFREQLDVWSDMCRASDGAEKKRVYDEWERTRFRGEYWEWGEREREKERAKL